MSAKAHSQDELLLKRAARCRGWQGLALMYSGPALRSPDATPPRCQCVRCHWVCWVTWSKGRAVGTAAWTSCRGFSCPGPHSKPACHATWLMDQSNTLALLLKPREAHQRRRALFLVAVGQVRPLSFHLGGNTSTAHTSGHLETLVR